jgi:antitoxin (DNA-binding transcriptional repressor) of toxin-antitoxin stability system
MKTATVRQLRTEFPKVLAWVNAGQEVTITRRRQIVASLVPAGNRPKRKTVLPDFRARLRRTYGARIIPAAVMADILAENKGRF